MSAPRPGGSPVMHQTWDKLLFLHYAVPVDRLRAMMPPQLQPDEWNGEAWISVTPFTMYGIRPVGLPAIPVVSECHEMNVRTYVTVDGEPGIWFFSLDASNQMVVWGARKFFHLPYFHADMKLRESTSRIEFSSRREGVAEHRQAPAELHGSWSMKEPLPTATPATLEYFLTERYCLYALDDTRLLRARIHHQPWPLAGVEIHSLHSTMLSSQGLPDPGEARITQLLREPLHVEVWPPETVTPP